MELHLTNDPINNEHSDEQIRQNVITHPSLPRRFPSPQWSVGIILVVLAGAALWGYSFFSSHVKDQISLTITAPTTVKDGEQGEYLITYKNNSFQSLHGMVMGVRYPDTFVFESADPQPSNERNSFWKLPDLSGKARGIISIKGRFVSHGPTTASLKAILTYMPDRVSSSFETDAEVSTHIEGSTHSLSLSGPLTTQPENEVEYIVSYRVDPAHAQSTALTMTFPKDFSLKSSSLSADAGSSTWSGILLTKDVSDGQGTLSLKGVFHKSQTGAQTIRAELTDGSDKPLLQEFLTNLDAPALTLSLGGMPKNILPGTPLHLTARVSNAGTVSFKNLTLEVKIDGDIIDWTQMKNGDEQGKTILLTTETTPVLTEIKAGKKISIPFDIPIKSIENLGAGARALKFTTRIYGEGVDISAGILQGHIASDTAITSSYTILSGQEKPTIGQTTTYRITLTLKNTLTELKDVLLTATIPDSVSWLSEYTLQAGAVHYDPDAREVQWTLNRMPATVHSIDLVFDVSRTPLDQSDLTTGKIIKNIKATARTTSNEQVSVDGVLSL